jgi:hypothetical protein
MKVIIIDNNNQQVPVDAAKLRVNNISLEEYLQIVKDAEAKLKAFEVKYQKLHEDYLAQLQAQEDKFRDYVKALRNVWVKVK